MLLTTPSHLNMSLSGSPTTPVSSAITEFGILKVEAGSFASPGTILVAGDHQIIVDLVADEGADGSLVGKMPGQILADLAALGCDVGKAARRQNARGGKQAEQHGDDRSRQHPV